MTYHYGFRKRFCFQQWLLALMEHWKRVMIRKAISQKHFHCLLFFTNRQLLNYMQLVLTWLILPYISCLGNRKQKVYIDDEFNSSDKIIHGFPQVLYFAPSFLTSSFVINKTDNIMCYAEGSTFETSKNNTFRVTEPYRSSHRRCSKKSCS